MSDNLAVAYFFGPPCSRERKNKKLNVLFLSMMMMI